jgi:hypothetical protein
MTHNIGNNGNGLYNCRTKKLKTSKHCNNGNIYDYQFEEILKKLCEGGIAEELELKNRWLIDTCVEWVEEKLGFIERNRDTTTISELYKQIQEHKQALTKLYKKQALESTDEDAIEEAIKETKEELEKMEADYTKITKKPAVYLKECADLLDICYDAISAIENPKITYTEEEILDVVERFTVYSEVQKIKGGLHGAPKVSVVPILKTELLLSTKYNIALNPTAPIIGDLGVEKEIFLPQLKNRMDGLKQVIKDLKNVYISSMD